MENLLGGISTLLLCAVGFFYAWRQQAKGNYKWGLGLLLLCGFLLRLYTAFDFYLHDWDERFHALVAKHLLQHPLIPTLYDRPLLPYDYRDWSANHVWLHKQPLPLWAMAASMKLLGINEIALRLPSVFLSTIGIGLTFAIGRYFFHEKTAFLAAFLYAVNGLIIELSGGRTTTDPFDVFMLFFVEMGVFCAVLYCKQKQTIFNIGVGLSMGAAILSKWLPACIVFPIWLLMAMGERLTGRQIMAQSGIIIAVAALVVVPWQIYIFSHFPIEAKWEAAYNMRHLFEIIEGHNGNYFYYLNKIRINYGELIYLPLLWFFHRSFSQKNDFKRMAVWCWFFIPFLFFSYAATKMQAYILFTAPALFFMTADFFNWFAAQKINSIYYKWLRRVILCLLIALPVRYAVERVKPFSLRDRNPAWVAALRAMNHKDIQQGVLFHYSRPIEAMFYTGFMVYRALPTAAQIDDLRSKGYTIMINNHAENLPDALKNRTDILFENILEP
jgi:4-amino-4-deoxy-L-arabinose transferase